MARPARPSPNTYTDSWTDDACIDPAAETARQFAINLTKAIDGRSLRTIGELTEVDYSAISRILNGDTWADLATIARLEHGLGAAIYPPYRPVD
jgi:transcriptional regulator with XRE-family HTH domain